jgi:hypothetical protein
MAVPQNWMDVLGHLRTALIDRDIMRNRTMSQKGRDIATVRYSQSLDAMVVALEGLSDDQTLDRITTFLASDERD